jgi:autotransporter passenger strand-loop-strand repeat protein
VFAGGSAVATQVDSGARAIVGRGGAAGDTVISGGLLEIVSGGSVGSSTMTFAANGGGVLELDDAQHFGGAVAGFGQPDRIDLRDIAFGSGTTLSFTQAAGNTSGTLAVSDSVHTANILLIGQYATAQFTLAGDAHGGSVVGYAPVVAAADGQQLGVTAPNNTPSA